MEVRPLPKHPSLEQYRKQAKDLLRSLRSTDAAIRAWAQKWFDDCADLYVETEARLRGIEITPALRSVVEREFIDRTDKRIRTGRLSEPGARLADAQFFIARGHGFESWSSFSSQIRALQDGNTQDAAFETAADAIVSGDIGRLQRLLSEDPGLIAARSRRTHRGTLLHYVAANGIEDFRQKTPANIVPITKLLLDAGADVNAESSAYGGPALTLGLAATSVHPERAGVQEALLGLLIDHGATMDVPGSAGNGHTVIEGCFWNGRGRAAKFLAARGAPLNLETAAGTGRLDVVRSCFDERGTLWRGATQRQLQRGFLWACQFGCHDVAEFLLARGADLKDQADTSETALHWAVIAGDVPMIRLLLNHGAPLEELNAYGGTALGQAGWSFLNGDPRVDYVPVFEVLLAAGAKIEDGFLTWLDGQEARPAPKKAEIAGVLRRYGATA